MSTRTRITLVAAAAFVAIAVAGCSSGGTPTARGTQAVTSPPPSSSAPASTAPASPSPTASAGAVAACTTAQLGGSVADSSGAAGSTYSNLILTNKGTTSCTIQGWPGVSIVGDGNGTQIGQAAAFDRTSVHHTITLVRGGSAKALLRIVEAGNYSASTCGPLKGNGLRVYPPGQKASLFISLPNVTGCTATSVSLLTVGAFS